MGSEGGRKATDGERGSEASRGLLRRRLIGALYDESPERTPEWLAVHLLSAAEVAMLFRVSRRSVTSWARSGKLPFLTTPGGHRRFRTQDVRALLESSAAPPAAPTA